jgi:hypothetical protein
VVTLFQLLHLLSALIWKALGLILILLGAALLGWVAYNLFVERLPETKGRDPFGPIKFGVLMIGAGVIVLREPWHRRQRPVFRRPEPS